MLEDTDFEQYIRNMKCSGKWGGNLEIQVLISHKTVIGNGNEI